MLDQVETDALGTQGIDDRQYLAPGDPPGMADTGFEKSPGDEPGRGG